MSMSRESAVESGPYLERLPRVEAWLAHLMAGGTSSWHDFNRLEVTATPLPVGAATRLPGAQNLALLRRLNVAGSPSAHLVQQVLAASLPGRGRPDLLVRGADEPRWGTRPVDPDTLPAAELLRVAVGLLADRVAAAPLAEAGRRRPRHWARHYELSGDPWRVSTLGDSLVADGRLPGGRAAHHLVLAGPLDQMLASLWTRRAHGDGIQGWQAWLEGWARRDALPERLDVATLAETAAARLGPDRTHLVLDPSALPALLGVRHPIATTALAGAGSADLARRIASALRIRVPTKARRERTWQVLAPALARPGEQPVTVPQEFSGWLQERAEVLVRRVRAGDYAVHGDPSLLWPGTAGAAARPVPPAQTLAWAVELLLDERWPISGERQDREVDR